MTMHKKNRNIIFAHGMGSTLDVAFGPSDDDFHYQQHHGTVAHEESVHVDKEVGVKLIFEGGCCEVQWSGKDSATNEYKWDGFLNIQPDGKLSFPFSREDGEPFYLEFDSNGLRVFGYEGEPPDDEREQWLLFDSAKVASSDGN